MSRVSIERRMERVRDAILPPGSLEWRLDRLPVHLKQTHQSWREKVDAINHASAKIGHNRYEMLLNGNDDTPPMPIAVHRAIWPDGESIPAITSITTADQAAEIYNQVLAQGGSKQ